MKKNVLFIQGGGDGGYEADARLVSSLEAELGKTYELHYPQLSTDETLPDFGWSTQIGEEIAKLKDNAILVAHSLGASLLLKYLSENKIKKKIAGILLISTPFWRGNEDWKQGLKLHENFPDKLPKGTPVFLYQALDDEEVSFENLSLYSQKLLWATIREISKGGHQLNNDVSIVAKDIMWLSQ